MAGPRSLRLLARLLLPARDREFIIGDLDELYAKRLREEGRTIATMAGTGGNLLWGGLRRLVLLRFFVLRRWAPEVRRALSLVGMLPVEQDGIEQKAKRAERLSTPLRPKPDQDDVALAVANIDRRGESIDLLLAQEVARKKR